MLVALEISLWETTRGFESHPLRQREKRLKRLFFLWHFKLMGFEAAFKEMPQCGVFRGREIVPGRPAPGGAPAGHADGRFRIPPSAPRRSKLYIACSDFHLKIRARSCRCSSFSAKRHACCGCSLVNALTTPPLRYQLFAVYLRCYSVTISILPTACKRG